jgi:aerobic carbon-monoxide dehydrogenase large subunit
VATNKGRYVAYRGPWANETWARERMLDIVARALGMRPTDLRLKNMMGQDDMAPAMITGPTLDATMSTKQTLERAIELIDIDTFRAEQERARAAGRYLGLGIASYHEAAPGPPNYWSAISPGSDVLMGEEAWTAVMPDGSIEVYTSQMPHGQSHETTYGQIVADELGVSRHDVKIVYGDTNRTPFSIIGTGGSRGGPMGGGAVKYSSREVRQQLVEQAAKMLEALPADIEIVDGNVHVAGVPVARAHRGRCRRVGGVRTRHGAGQRCRGQG